MRHQLTQLVRSDCWRLALDFPIFPQGRNALLRSRVDSVLRMVFLFFSLKIASQSFVTWRVAAERSKALVGVQKLLHFQFSLTTDSCKSGLSFLNSIIWFFKGS